MNWEGWLLLGLTVLQTACAILGVYRGRDNSKREKPRLLSEPEASE
jgi:hypothetical protein